MDANMVPIFVGLDYHMNSVQVCAMNQGGVVLVNQSVPNDWRAIAEVVPSGGCVSAGIEACTPVPVKRGPPSAPLGPCNDVGVHQ